MLFLLNDVLFDLDQTCPVPARDARRFEKVGLDYVVEMACELFADEPMLHRTEPVKARRLAWLLAQKADGVNAALFAAPDRGCAAEVVEPRFCVLPEPVMRQLRQRAGKGRLDAVTADKVVWGRMAA